VSSVFPSLFIIAIPAQPMHIVLAFLMLAKAAARNCHPPYSLQNIYSSLGVSAADAKGKSRYLS
jgi:hypothetical protein